MIDLRQYIQKSNDWTWVEREELRLGENGLSAMQNAIYNTLMKVPPDKYFDIEKNVKPENYEVFIKTVCEFLQYYPNYRFNRLMNKIHHDYPILMSLKNATDEQKKERQRMERERRRLPA